MLSAHSNLSRMWEYEYSVQTAADPRLLWAHWSDMASWPRWNDGIAKIEVDGPFEVGTVFRMSPPGEEPIEMRLTEIVPGESFTDEMDAGDFVVRTVHRLVAMGDGITSLVYRTEISGPAADQVGPEIGPQITGDFPDVLAKLVTLAE
jgi:uncharacterized protein YndB with AHSA1/START domain